MKRSGWIATGLLASAALAFVALRSDQRPAAARGERRDAGPPRFVAAPPAAPHPLDLQELRRALPDNSYWANGAPTDDATTLEARAREERKRNQLYGRVLEGTASEAEITRYYDGLRRQSEDYLRVAEEALRRPSLSERDRGLFALAVRMNRDRLASLPREREKALERKRLHDRLR